MVEWLEKIYNAKLSDQATAGAVSGRPVAQFAPIVDYVVFTLGAEVMLSVRSVGSSWHPHLARIPTLVTVFSLGSTFT